MNRFLDSMLQMLDKLGEVPGPGTNYYCPIYWDRAKTKEDCRFGPDKCPFFWQKIDNCPYTKEGKDAEAEEGG